MDLDETSERYLATLEQDERSFEAGADVYDEGLQARHLYVVKHGWFYGFADLPDGRRQIVKIYHPGDVIGFPDIAFHHATITVRAAEPGCLCPFPKARLNVILEGAPRLTALLLALAVRDEAILYDRIRATGRMSAMERVAYMLLELSARLSITVDDAPERFRLPLNQAEMGDYLALTNVYVSKTLSRMEDMELIERTNDKYVRILEREKLVQLCDFVDRYADLDISWFPEPGGGD